MTTGQLHPVDPSPALRAYGACVDGLFTYCLSVLCDHDAATAAVLEVRDLARRHGDRLTEPALLRAWLYALARNRCLTRLNGTGTPAAEAAPAPDVLRERRRELASLAWPEAAGTDPEQREALELAVRHRLDAGEVAAVLGLTPEAAAALLDAAGAEIGRTRTALLVLGVGSCPQLAQLGGVGGVGAESGPGRVLGAALRRELVLHLEECPTCRGTAERVAGQLGQGLAGLPGLPLLTAPARLRPAPATGGTAFLSGAAAGRRAVRGLAGGEPQFDRRGFPRHRVVVPSRGSAVRQRVVTTGVLAAVLAAPVVALWSAHQGGDREGRAAAVSSVRVDAPVQEAQPAVVLPPAMSSLQLAGAVAAETSLPTAPSPAVTMPAHGASRLSGPTPTPAPTPDATREQLTVEARAYGSRTVLTLTNSGDTALIWHAVLDVDWLRLSRDDGILAPGQRITVTVTVDETRAPQTRWTARLALPPSTAVVTLEGGGTEHRGVPTPTPTPSPDATPSPTESPSPSATPSASPS
ncbi:hypothetical protein ACIHEI_20665 [Kitasatospora sp. NPDC051984]|uniref:BACON domain-containing protein n=1 Tax=Kitasatospora sp. NPDC051984 TaxID=3364059 RepID=UPI0037C7E709